MKKPIVSMFVTAGAIAVTASCASPHFRDTDSEGDSNSLSLQHDFEGRFPLIGDFYGESNDWAMINRV